MASKRVDPIEFESVVSEAQAHLTMAFELLAPYLVVLSDDARLSMPPEPIQCDGPHAVAEYLRQRGFWGADLRLVATRANGQPAFGYYLPDSTTSQPRPRGLIVLTLSGGRISTLTRFGGPDIFARFGLPLDVDGHRRGVG